MITVITGSNGFTGKYLSEYIKKENSNITTCGIDISPESKNSYIDKYFSANELISLSDYLLHSNTGFKVFHLAGLLKGDCLEKLIEANVLYTAKYIDVFRKLPNLEMFINVGSSAEYGIQDEKFLDESLPPHPVTPYGISKTIQADLVLHSARVYGFKAISTRTFNLIGPGLGEGLVVGRLVNEFLRIKNGEKKFCEIGRTDSIRNFIDVRNAVKIYWLFSEKGEPGNIYNVGHPESYSIEDILNLLSEIIGVYPEFKNTIKSNPQFDIDYQYPNLEKINLSIEIDGYYSIKESLKDMATYSASHSVN